MNFGYTCSGRSPSKLAKQLLVAVGVLALPIPVRLDTAVSAKPTSIKLPQPPGPDARAIRLNHFLSRLHCPVASLAEDFVHAADENHIDWRLLPSIAIIESSGGKAYKNNNIFGWDNGDQSFPTVRAGLNQVAFKLGKSSLYRGRDSYGKLRLYNPDENYAYSVLAVMRRISPVVDLTPARETIVRRQSEYVYTS
jgi:hypothetical protein